MKAFLTLVVVAFCVTLAVVIGNRMSTEAMAVVIGVVCGVAASIPMSLLILILTGRTGRGNGGQAEAQRSYPPVVVIQGGQPLSLPSMGGMAPYPSLANPSWQQGQGAEFRVVGDEAQ